MADMSSDTFYDKSVKDEGKLIDLDEEKWFNLAFFKALNLFCKLSIAIFNLIITLAINIIVME